ncbi:hypothetical protein Pfo_026107 [Paulownia fortunei]|nr:hypothetical protein Pfo_026107 [Paulownia fortunei]
MRILRPPSGPGGPGPGQDWDGPRPRLGLLHGFLYNLCTAVSSCFYVFCCCWLIEDCFMGQRSRPGPPFGAAEPPPPPPPHVGPGPHGPFGSLFGPPGPPRQPGPVGYPGEPAPF